MKYTIHKALSLLSRTAPFSSIGPSRPIEGTVMPAGADLNGRATVKFIETPIMRATRLVLTPSNLTLQLSNAHYYYITAKH